MGYSEFMSLICLNEALMADDSIVITTSLTLPASSREPTCAKAAADGNLEALKWLVNQMDALGREDFLRSGCARTPQGFKIGTQARLSVGCVDVQQCCRRRTSRGSEMGARQRVPVGRLGLPVGGREKASRGTGVLR